MNIEFILPLFIACIVVVPVCVWGIRQSLKQYQKMTNGQVSTFKEALHYEKQVYRKLRQIDRDKAIERYKSFTQEHTSFQQFLYIFNIVGVYIENIGLVLFIILLTQGLSEKTYLFLAGCWITLLGTLSLTMQGSISYYKNLRYKLDTIEILLHPVIRCIPDNHPSLLNWIFSLLFIGFGIISIYLSFHL